MHISYSYPTATSLGSASFTREFRNFPNHNKQWEKCERRETEGKKKAKKTRKDQNRRRRRRLFGKRLLNNRKSLKVVDGTASKWRAAQLVLLLFASLLSVLAGRYFRLACSDASFCIYTNTSEVSRGRESWTVVPNVPPYLDRNKFYSFYADADADQPVSTSSSAQLLL